MSRISDLTFEQVMVPSGVVKCLSPTEVKFLQFDLVNNPVKNDRGESVFCSR